MSIFKKDCKTSGIFIQVQTKSQKSNEQILLREEEREEEREDERGWERERERERERGGERENENKREGFKLNKWILNLFVLKN